MKKIIDIEQPFQSYKVIVSEVRGYLIDVAASSEEEALTYAKVNKTYIQYDSRIVDTHYQIYKTEKEEDDESAT